MEEEIGVDWDYYYERHRPDEEESPQEVLEREIEQFNYEEV